MSDYINRNVSTLESDIEGVTSEIHRLEGVRARLGNALVALIEDQYPLTPNPEVTPGEQAPEVTPASPLPDAGARKIKGPLKVSEVRDAVLAFDGEFTQAELAAAVGRALGTVHPKLSALIRNGIVVKCGVRTSPTNMKSMLYKYNSELPPGPTERPKEPTPESLAVGASLSNGTAATNGRVQVSNKTIQGFIDVAINQGWEVTHKNGNHYKFKSPDGRTVGVNAKPPSIQVCDVIKRDLKRSGLRIA